MEQSFFGSLWFLRQWCLSCPAKAESPELSPCHRDDVASALEKKEKRKSRKTLHTGRISHGQGGQLFCFPFGAVLRGLDGLLHQTRAVPRAGLGFLAVRRLVELFKPHLGGGGRGGKPHVGTEVFGELPAAEVVWQQNSLVRS